MNGLNCACHGRKFTPCACHCSPFTCKNCKCFKRVQDREEENLTLSNQYQDYIDQMSDEEVLSPIFILGDGVSLHIQSLKK